MENCYEFLCFKWPKWGFEDESFWSPTQVFLCSLLFRANNRSAATKRGAVPFGEGEEGGLVLLVNLDDREAWASKSLLPPPAFLPTHQPDTSRLDCSNSLNLELSVNCAGSSWPRVQPSAFTLVQDIVSQPHPAVAFNVSWRPWRQFSNESINLMLHEKLKISLWPNLKAVLQVEIQLHLMKGPNYDAVSPEESWKTCLCNQGNEEVTFWFSSGIWRRTPTALHIHRQPEKGGEQWGSTVCRWHHGIQGSENKGLQKDMMRLSEWAIKQQIKFNEAKCEVTFIAGKMFWTSRIKLWALGSLRSMIFGL